jgi:hypothetical protein
MQYYCFIGEHLSVLFPHFKSYFFSPMYSERLRAAGGCELVQIVNEHYHEEDNRNDLENWIYMFLI